MKTRICATVRVTRLGVMAVAGLFWALAAVGCGGDAPTDAADPGVTRFRVGLLTPGSIRDGGWNQGAYEGLVRIRDELGAEIAHQETKTPQDFESGFRDLAARGYDLVIGHGFEFQDAAATVGAEYPRTVFVTTSGSTVRDNVAPIVFELEQATYVLGHLGARLSRTGRLGAVGGVKVPSVASTFFAFEEGARAAGRSATVTVSYTGSWTDVAAAREATRALVEAGADVVIHNANEGAHGFFRAVEDSPAVLAFGANKDQTSMAPGSVLASATLDVAAALVRVAAEVQRGEFRARPLRFGLADGVIAIAWNPVLRARIPDEEWAVTEDLVRRIESGALEVPRGGF